MIESLEEAEVSGREDGTAASLIDQLVNAYWERFTEATPPGCTGAGDPIEADCTVQADPQELADFIKMALNKVQLRDLVQLQATQHAWVRQTFNYKHPVQNVAMHLRKEALEVAENPNDLEEYAGCLLLLLNMVTWSPFSLGEVADEAWNVLERVQSRTYCEDSATGIWEHDRSKEAPKEDPERRLAACLKACEGIETRALEYGLLRQLLEVVGDVCYSSERNLTKRELELLASRLRVVFAKALQAEDKARR